MAGAIGVAGLELRGGQSEEGCDAEQIGFGDVDEALFVAAPDTAWLALEAEGAAQIGNRVICFGCIWQGLRFILNNEGPDTQWGPTGTEGD